MNETGGPEELERRSEREILLGDRMAALGRLAASVAHEVRNPLGAIDIQLQLLQEELRAGSGERAGERLDTARAELRRLDRIVQNFLRFSRPPALHLTRVSLPELLGRLRELIEPEARERGIALKLRREEEGDTVIDADENLLSQAFLNLLINALQAYDETGGERRGSGARVEIRLRAADDRSALVTICDRGCGIPPGDLERIFEYYYTTKDTGTGLGLSIAQRIIDQHQGSLEVESEEGAGTTVSVRLPLAVPSENRQT